MTFKLIPEFLDYGYHVSYTAGGSVSWSKYNSSSSVKQVVIKSVYDTFKVTSYTETYPHSGTCTVSTSYKNIYKGWHYDFD